MKLSVWMGTFVSPSFIKLNADDLDTCTLNIRSYI